jgi:hypothetical protein
MCLLAKVNVEQGCVWEVDETISFRIADMCMLVWDN